VGRRNYRYFFTFVSSGTLVGLYLLGASLAQILVYMNRQSISFGAAINHFRVPFAMVIYGAVATPYLLALMVYHLFLMGRGETTREYLNSHKFLKKDRHRPFTQGNILDSARAAGLPAPFACKAGVCATCRAKVVKGTVEMAARYGLTDEEVAEGYVLTCQSVPLGDGVAVDYDA